MDRHHRYAVGGSVAFGAIAAFDIGRVVLRRPWAQLAPAWSDGLSLALASLFVASALTLPLRPDAAWLDAARWALAMVAVLALMTHAAIAFWLHDGGAIAPLVTTIVAGFCLKRTFDRGELQDSSHHASRRAHRELALAVESRPARPSETTTARPKASCSR